MSIFSFKASKVPRHGFQAIGQGPNCLGSILPPHHIVLVPVSAPPCTVQDPVPALQHIIQSLIPDPTVSSGFLFWLPTATFRELFFALSKLWFKCFHAPSCCSSAQSLPSSYSEALLSSSSGSGSLWVQVSLS